MGYLRCYTGHRIFANEIGKIRLRYNERMILTTREGTTRAPEFYKEQHFWARESNTNGKTTHNMQHPILQILARKLFSDSVRVVRRPFGVLAQRPEGTVQIYSFIHSFHFPTLSLQISLSIPSSFLRLSKRLSQRSEIYSDANLHSNSHPWTLRENNTPRKRHWTIYREHYTTL